MFPGPKLMISQSNWQPESLSPTMRMWMHVCITGLRPVLRPSARRDLTRYLQGIRDDDAARAWSSWAQMILDAHRTDVTGGRRVRDLLRSAPVGLFRRPDRA